VLCFIQRLSAFLPIPLAVAVGFTKDEAEELRRQAIVESGVALCLREVPTVLPPLEEASLDER
jgi:hypothetical protein